MLHFKTMDFPSTFCLFKAGFNLRKVNRHIKFPEVIDLAPFCTVKCKVSSGITLAFSHVLACFLLLSKICVECLSGYFFVTSASGTSKLS